MCGFVKILLTLLAVGTLTIFVPPAVLPWHHLWNPYLVTEAPNTFGPSKARQKLRMLSQVAGEISV